MEARDPVIVALGEDVGRECCRLMKEAIMKTSSHREAAQVATFALCSIAGMAGAAFAASIVRKPTDSDNVKYTEAALNAVKEMVLKRSSHA